MKAYDITWAENPLASRVVLTDYGRLLMRYNMAVDELQTASVLIGMDRGSDRPKDGLWVDQFDYLGKEDDAIKAEINRQASSFEEELLGTHCGDCTHVPCGCMKCHAEGLLGFYSTEGLDGGAGACIQGAFSQVTTITEALDMLRYPAPPTWGTPEDWAPHQARWDATRARTITWLTDYGKQHGFLTA